MYNYDLSEQAKEDLLRIYEYGIGQFGLDQADKYFDMYNKAMEKSLKKYQGDDYEYTYIYE